MDKAAIKEVLIRTGDGSNCIPYYYCDKNRDRDCILMLLRKHADKIADILIRETTVDQTAKLATWKGN